MAASIVERKGVESAGLTPLPAEKRALPQHVHDAEFPNDYPTMNVSVAIANVRAQLLRIEEAQTAIAQQARLIEEALAAIDAVMERPAEEAPPVSDVADAPDLSERFAALSKRAQDETFATVDPTGEAEAAEVGWACPDHGTQDIITDKSPKGREFRRCNICRKFER